MIDDLHEGRLELVREVTTMALYVSLSILAALIALPVAQNDDRVQAGLTVLATGLGLVLAHHLSLRMSSRLVNGGQVSEVLLLGFGALVGYRSARFTSGVGRSLLYVGVIVGAVAAVIAIKLLAGY